MQIKVTNIQRGCVHDGPGVRTTVFLKGCSLNCPWCCNPETILNEEEYFIDDTKCIFLNGINSSICKNCFRKNGKEPISQCPFGVGVSSIKKYSKDDLVSEVLKNRKFYTNGGGVTFSGGEPLLQAKELEQVLKLINNEKIHIVFETTLIANEDMLKLVIPYVNLFIIDLKLQREYLSSSYIAQITQKIAILKQMNKDFWFRLVVVKAMSSYVEDIVKVLHNLNINQIELLRCHNLGKSKYIKLGIPNYDYSCTEIEFNIVADYIKDNGISITCLSL